MTLQTQEVPQKQYHFVYKTTNLVNNKIYVGVHNTNNIDDSYLGSGSVLNKAIKKYGRENFKRDILYFCCSREDAFIIESEIVDQEFIIKSDNYNQQTGGISNNGINPEYREKLSNALKGKKKSEEHKEKLRIINTGKKQSIETINKKIEKIKGQKRSEETKEKQRNASKGKKKSEEHKNNMRKPKSEEHRKHISEGGKKRYEDPKEREKAVAASKGRKWYVNELGETQFETANNQELFNLGYKYGRKY